MKRTVTEHERSAANRAANLVRLREQLELLQSQVRRESDALDYFHKQISRARAEGKTAFDDEKFKGEK